MSVENILQAIEDVTDSVQAVIDKRDDYIVRLYVDEKKSFKDIGALLKIYPSTVRRILKRRGVDARPRGRPPAEGIAAKRPRPRKAA